MKVCKLLSSCSRSSFSQNTHLSVLCACKDGALWNSTLAMSCMYALSSCWAQWRMDYTEEICVASWQMMCCRIKLKSAVFQVSHQGQS